MEALLCCAVTEHWHRLPRSCGVSSLGIFQCLLDMALGTLLWVSQLEQGLGQKDPEHPSHPNDSMNVLRIVF